MQSDSNERTGNTEPLCADRIGFARLTTMAFDGIDLRPLRDALIAKIADGTADAGEGLDLSLITQLLGDKQTGLVYSGGSARLSSIVSLALFVRQQPKLRVLALAAAIDMGGNTPIEFLLEESGIELMTLYVIPGIGLPAPLPDHDVAIVIASDSEECRDALRYHRRGGAALAAADAESAAPRLQPGSRQIASSASRHRGARYSGDDVCDARAVVRAWPGRICRSPTSRPSCEFPLIVRPRGSHAGVGLAKIDDRAAIARYLAERTEQEFFVSRFVDYANEDGLFRKYRVVFVDGRPYACHMAIADRWDIWYLNAGMSDSAAKRLEEETFMRTFDIGFARRHATALAGMADRIGLDYFTIDCAENKRGELLVFEADNTAVVHNMDSPEMFPYKPPQMRKIFEAFAAMLVDRAAAGAGARGVTKVLREAPLRSGIERDARSEKLGRHPRAWSSHAR